MAGVKLIHHVNVQISDRARTRDWYEKVLGAEFLDRGPPMDSSTELTKVVCPPATMLTPPATGLRRKMGKKGSGCSLGNTLKNRETITPSVPSVTVEGS